MNSTHWSIQHPLPNVCGNSTRPADGLGRRLPGSGRISTFTGISIRSRQATMELEGPLGRAPCKALEGDADVERVEAWSALGARHPPGRFGRLSPPGHADRALRAATPCCVDPR